MAAQKSQPLINNLKLNKMKTILFTITSLLLVLSCAQDRVTGNGKIVKETRNVGIDFNEVESAGAFDVFINDGPQDGKIVLEGESNVLETIEIEIEGNTLVIKNKKGINIKSNKKVTVTFNAKNLQSIGLSGSGNIISEGTHNADNFKVGLSGSGNIQASMNSKNSKAAISGSGNIELSGETESLEAGISGSGNIEAFELDAQNVKIAVSGSGNVEVAVSEKLEGSSAGSGGIFYKGDPEIVQVKSAGSGKVQKM